MGHWQNFPEKSCGSYRPGRCGPVDYDGGVEKRFVVLAMKGSETLGGSSNGIGLSGAGGVLAKIAPSRPVGPGLLHEDWLRRHRTAKGKSTLLYAADLNLPRRMSATLQALLSSSDMRLISRLTPVYPED